MIRLAALSLILLFFQGPVAAMSGRASHVSDGDTLWVRPADGGRPIKLRLHGLDAPEVCQGGGREARDALKRLVGQRPLQVETYGRDAWGRTLARISIDQRDLGAMLVQEGHAWSDAFRDDPGPYAAQEAAARRARRGLFADAKAQRPRDFRRYHGPCESTSTVPSP